MMGFLLFVTGTLAIVPIVIYGRYLYDFSDDDSDAITLPDRLELTAAILAATAPAIAVGKVVIEKHASYPLLLVAIATSAVFIFVEVAAGYKQPTFAMRMTTLAALVAALCLSGWLTRLVFF